MDFKKERIISLRGILMTYTARAEKELETTWKLLHKELSAEEDFHKFLEETRRLEEKLAQGESVHSELERRYKIIEQLAEKLEKFSKEILGLDKNLKEKAKKKLRALERAGELV